MNTKQCAKGLSYLLVSDDNYFPGLVAQINSILRHSPGSRIYLVHNLSPLNFSKIKSFIYKSEFFDEKPWSHLPSQSRHITKISLGRFQADFIEETHFFYMDSDIIMQKEFALKEPDTIAIEFKTQPVRPEIDHIDRFELMRKFIFDNGGETEKEGDFTLFADAIFYVNKKWLLESLKPKIVEVSKKYVEQNILQRWFDMQYFHTAICILGKNKVEELPIKNAWMGLPFDEKQYPDFFRFEKIEDCELLHFCSAKKPWIREGFVKNREAEKIWFNYYQNGPAGNE